MKTTTLDGALAEHIRAVNAHDVDAILDTFRDDAYVQDAGREIIGKAAIRAFIEKEVVGDEVTYEVLDVRDHHGEIIVRATTDGLFDKSGLPDPVVLTHYFRLAGDKIASIVTLLVRESEY